MWRGWIPREGRLWLAVGLLTVVSCFGGAMWGASGKAWQLGASRGLALPAAPSHDEAVQADPSKNLYIIMKNNVLVYLSLTLGLVTAGLWTLLTYLWWGAGTIGYAIGMTHREHLPTRLVIAMLAPHAPLEVLSYAFVAVVGLRLLWVGCEYLRSGNILVKKGEPAVWAVRIALGFVLMIGAAVVEAYVTPRVIRGELERELHVQAPR